MTKDTHLKTKRLSKYGYARRKPVIFPVAIELTSLNRIKFEYLKLMHDFAHRSWYLNSTMIVGMYEFDYLETFPGWVASNRPVFANPNWYYDNIESVETG